MTVADLIEALLREPQYLRVCIERYERDAHDTHHYSADPAPIRAVVLEGPFVVIRPADDWIY